MSRLAFQEEIGDWEHNTNEVEVNVVKANKKRKNISASYDLFNIADNSEDEEVVVVGNSSDTNHLHAAKGEVRETPTVNTKETIDRDDRNDVEHEVLGEGSESSVKKKKKKKKKKKSSADDLTQMIEASEPDISSHSNPTALVVRPKITLESNPTLQKFLSKKREFVVPPPPEVFPNSDTFLQEFNQHFPAQTEEEKNEFENNPTTAAEHESNSSSTIALRVPSSLPVTPRTPASQSDQKNIAVLQIYNLPYTATEEDIILLGTQHGFEFHSVVLGSADRKNQLPAGAAYVSLVVPAAIEMEDEENDEQDKNMPSASAASSDNEKDDDDKDAAADKPKSGANAQLNAFATKCLNALNGELMGGRPLRVQRCKPSEARKRLSRGLSSLGGGGGDGAGSRYFVLDISVKCNACGQVGHKQFDCTEEALPIPCHLCAGKDHEAMHCPNITCFRCGKFGHHSKQCNNSSMSRPVVCTQCGSTTHDFRRCRQHVALIEGDARGGPSAGGSSKMVGPSIQCMVCREYGHEMCQPMPEIPSWTPKPAHVASSDVHTSRSKGASAAVGAADEKAELAQEACAKSGSRDSNDGGQSAAGMSSNSDSSTGSNLLDDSDNDDDDQKLFRYRANSSSSSDSGSRSSSGDAQENEEEQIAVKNAVFCPNCGEQGHYIDLVPASVRYHTNEDGPLEACYCLVPKYEALMKFPQVLKELDSFDSGDSSLAARNDLYRLALRSAGGFANHRDQQNFPSFAAEVAIKQQQKWQQQQQQQHHHQQRHSFGGDGGGGGGRKVILSDSRDNNGTGWGYDDNFEDDGPSRANYSSYNSRVSGNNRDRNAGGTGGDFDRHRHIAGDRRDRDRSFDSNRGWENNSDRSRYGGNDRNSRVVYNDNNNNNNNNNNSGRGSSENVFFEEDVYQQEHHHINKRHSFGGNSDSRQHVRHRDDWNRGGGGDGGGGGRGGGCDRDVAYDQHRDQQRNSWGGQGGGRGGSAAVFGRGGRGGQGSASGRAELGTSRHVLALPQQIAADEENERKRMDRKRRFSEPEPLRAQQAYQHRVNGSSSSGNTRGTGGSAPALIIPGPPDHNSGHRSVKIARRK